MTRDRTQWWLCLLVRNHVQSEELSSSLHVKVNCLQHYAQKCLSSRNNRNHACLCTSKVYYLQRRAQQCLSSRNNRNHACLCTPRQVPATEFVTLQNNKNGACLFYTKHTHARNSVRNKQSILHAQRPKDPNISTKHTYIHTYIHASTCVSEPFHHWS